MIRRLVLAGVFALGVPAAPVVATPAAVAAPAPAARLEVLAHPDAVDAASRFVFAAGF